MRITVLTIFPEIFTVWAETSLIRQARQSELLDWHVIDLKVFSGRRDGRIDDRPFGGGPGMVYRPEPILEALESVPDWHTASRWHFSPAGEPWRQNQAAAVAQEDASVILLCSRYEGVDQRALSLGGFQELSLGDWVSLGGEVPAMAWVESVVRLLPGALGDSSSSWEDSFSAGRQGLLDCPHYTRPALFRGLGVPEDLVSGDHSRIAAWRRDHALALTRKRRPDLLPKGPHGT